MENETARILLNNNFYFINMYICTFNLRQKDGSSETSECCSSN